MKNLLLKFVTVLLMTSLIANSSFAQNTMDVAKFTKLEKDLMARVTKPVRDKDEGKLCALVRVVTSLTNLEIRADALGIVHQEIHNGEWWIYVPYGARSLSFSHEGYFPLLYQYSLPIEEGVVYELRLSSYETSTEDGIQNLNTQMFVLTHNPDNATVFIDEMEVPTEHGVFAAMMSKGEHSYKVMADQYEEAEGYFMLEDSPLRESVTLQPLFGTIQLSTLPENDFQVFLNGNYVGRSPFQSNHLEPGNYRVRIEKENFYPIDTLVRLREGDNIQMSCKLTSFADSLFYNRMLGGHKISFGINVGYLQPFVSSKGNGGFTGSPVNYSLGNAHENVSYSSQSGFTVGIMTDIKLYKNFYFMTGINFSQYKYTNTFNWNFENIVVRSVMSQIYRGNMQANYKENYTINTLELPLLASYCIVLTKTGSLHLNFGPYIQYGLSAKMKLSGSSECNGKVFRRIGTDYSQEMGTFSETNHTSAEFNLYSKSFEYVKTTESAMNLGHEQKSEYDYEESPYKKLNFGLKFGVAYELRGFQLSLNYNLQLSNMANKTFWESARIPIFNNQVGENNMSGYKHRIHSFEIKLGYIFRY